MADFPAVNPILLVMWIFVGRNCDTLVSPLYNTIPDDKIIEIL